MFCTECGKRMREGAIFCPYCGIKQSVSIPAPKNTPDSTPKTKNPDPPVVKPTRPGSFISPILVVAVIAVVLYFVSTAYDCDSCGLTQVGSSYYDVDGGGKMCKECAEDYWAPFPVENYKN